MKKNLLIAFIVVLVIVAISVLFANIKRARLTQIAGPSEMTIPETAKVLIPAEPASVLATATTTAAGVKTEDIEKTQIASTEQTQPKDRNKLIQMALKNANLYTGEIDGKIGHLTKNAIEEFQRLKSLKVDGKVGPQTWAALKDYLPEDTQQQ